MEVQGTGTASHEGSASERSTGSSGIGASSSAQSLDPSDRGSPAQVRSPHRAGGLSMRAGPFRPRDQWPPLPHVTSLSALAAPLFRHLSSRQGYLHVEFDNNWRKDPSQPVIELEMWMEHGGDDPPFIMTRRTWRASSPGRAPQPLEEPLSPDAQQNDLIGQWMRSYPVRYASRAPVSDAALTTLSLESLEDEHLRIVTSHGSAPEPGTFMAMTDSSFRQDQALLERRARGEPTAGPHPRKVVLFHRMGEFIRQTTRHELDVGRGALNPLRSPIEEKFYAYERVCRTFLDHFDGRASPQALNARVREEDICTLEHDFDVTHTGHMKNTDASVSSSVPRSPSSVDTFPDDRETDPDQPSTRPPSTLAPSSDGRSSPDTGYATPDGTVSRIVRPGEPTSVSLSGDLHGALHQTYVVGSEQDGVKEVVRVCAALDEHVPLLVMRLRLVGHGQVGLVSSLISHWDRDTPLPDMTRTMPLADLEPDLRNKLLGRDSVGYRDFRREDYVGPDPDVLLKKGLFLVDTSHRLYKPGRCLVLDNRLNFIAPRERQVYKLSADQRTIEVKIFSRAGLADARAADDITLQKRYSLRVELNSPELLDLLRGDGVDRWNADVRGLARSLEDLHTV